MDYKIIETIEIILILDELDLSLAVLALTFCWEAEDVAHFKLNTMITKTKRRELTPDAVERLKAFNWLDEQLYSRAKQRLHDQVWQIGRDKVRASIFSVNFVFKFGGGVLLNSLFKKKLKKSKKQKWTP